LGNNERERRETSRECRWGAASCKILMPLQHLLEGMQLPPDLHFAHAARAAVAAVDGLRQ
jgi:hypothetical protein